MTEKEFHDVVRFLEETPKVVRQLTADLANRDLKWKSSEGEFSVIEQVCHLRDLEREGYAARIERMLTENRPSLPDFDGSRLARERDYNSQEFDSALREFARAREENIGLIKTIPPDQLNRSGVLEGVGTITLDRLLLLMKEHDQSHREELNDLRGRMRQEGSNGFKEKAG